MQQCVISAESIQNLQVALRCQQHLIVVLPVNVDESVTDLPQHRNCCGMAVHPCRTAAVCGDLSGKQQLIVGVGNGKCVQSGTDQRIQMREKCRHHCLFAACPHNVPRDTLSQNRMDPVQQNRFSGTGFTGKHIQMR